EAAGAPKVVLLVRASQLGRRKPSRRRYPQTSAEAGGDPSATPRCANIRTSPGGILGEQGDFGRLAVLGKNYSAIARVPMREAAVGSAAPCKRRIPRSACVSDAVDGRKRPFRLI